MFFEISKLLNIFISPISWIITLIIIYCVCRERRRLRIAALVSAVTLFILSTNMTLVEYVRYKSVEEYNTSTIDPTTRYKVAIVMGGFSSMNPDTGAITFEQDRADRLWEAVRLYKQGVVQNILITGDPATTIRENGNTSAPLFLNYMELLGVDPQVFILEQYALNTRQNAEYTVKILKEYAVKAEECILVTSITHMGRSLDCFSKEGYDLDYLPSNSYAAPRDINHRSFYPDWRAAIEWQVLINEWIGNLVYKIVGYK